MKVVEFGLGHEVKKQKTRAILIIPNRRRNKVHKQETVVQNTEDSNGMGTPQEYYNQEN